MNARPVKSAENEEQNRHGQSKHDVEQQLHGGGLASSKEQVHGSKHRGEEQEEDYQRAPEAKQRRAEDEMALNRVLIIFLDHPERSDYRTLACRNRIQELVGLSAGLPPRKESWNAELRRCTCEGTAQITEDYQVGKEDLSPHASEGSGLIACGDKS